MDKTELQIVGFILLLVSMVFIFIYSLVAIPDTCKSFAQEVSYNEVECPSPGTLTITQVSGEAIALCTCPGTVDKTEQPTAEKW